MINPLNELSGVYLEHIVEQHREPVHSYRSGGNEPGDVKTKVSQMVKAIRYKSRKEGGNMIKAFNDYMGGQSGIGAAERQMVKQKLGLQEENEVVDEYIDTVKKVKKAELDQDLKRWSEVEEDYETKKKGEVLGALKKRKGDFKKRYGKDAADVMYAVAAKTAKKKGDTSKSDDRYAYEDVKRDYQGPLYAPHPDLVREGKCEDCTCEGCGPDGVGHQDPCVECGGHHKEMKEVFSNWREDLREIADDIPETDKKMEVKIKEKNVKNKIVINPVLGGSGRDMGEEIKKIGGELLEMTEVEEQVAAGGAVPLSSQEIMIAKRQAMLQTRASKQRQRTLNKVKAEKEVKEELSDRAKKEVESDVKNVDNPLYKPGRRTLKQLTYARELHLKNQKKKVTSEEVKDKQGLDKYDRHKRMIRHKQDKYGRNVVGADYNLENERKAKGWKKKLNKEDKAFDNVVSMLRKKHGDSSVITKDSPKPKAQPQPKRKPQKDTRSDSQKMSDAVYGRTPWNKKGSLGT